MSNNTSNFTVRYLTDPRLDLEGIFGPLLVGVLLSMALWGVNSSQTYDYFTENTDRLLQRSVVALLWILDTVCSLMDSHLIYFDLVTNYANPAGALTIDWSSQYRVLPLGISNFTIRSMYACRAYHLSGKSFVPVIWIMAFSVGESAIYIYAMIISIRQTLVAGLQARIRLIYMICSFNLAADLSVTIILCWLLHSAKSGMRRSDSIVNALIVYIANTGLLVTITATLQLITFITKHDTDVYYAFGLVLSKLYVNAYVASLNARPRIREKGSVSSISLSRLDLSHSTRRSMQPGSDQKSTPVQSSFQAPVERSVDDDEVKIHPVAV